MNRPRPICCEAVQQHLAAYRSGEIHPALQRRIAQHLHACDSCYALYRNNQVLEQEMRQVLMAPPPVDFGRVWQGIQVDLARPTESNPPVRYALLATALLLMLLVPMTFGRSGIAWATPPTPPAPRSHAVVLLLERATPSPNGAVTLSETLPDTPASTPDAAYRTESLTVLSIMTP
ncbi:MAG: zf-HC2 domain-containing protein [Anaerolineae bacterium]|nr:zf-HC2 domain-containing protein [Anaerolineae bacterium]